MRIIKKNLALHVFVWISEISLLILSNIHSKWNEVSSAWQYHHSPYLSYRVRLGLWNQQGQMI